MTKLVGMLNAVVYAATACMLNAVAAVAESSPSWTLFHSLDGDNYMPRGRVVPATGDDDGDSILKVIPLDEKVANNFRIDGQTAQSLIQNYGWYHIWLVKNDKGPDQDISTLNMEPSAIVTVPACDIVRANFRDEFSFVLGRYGAGDKGEIVSMSYLPLISPLAPKTCEEELLQNRLKPEEAIKFESKVTDVIADTPGMTLKNVLPHVKPPPGMAFIPNPNKAKTGQGAGGEKAEPEPITGPWGFIQRYWYILLPLFIANFISAPDDQQEQGGQQGDGGAAAPAVAAAPAAASSPTKKARRGKRN